MKNILLLTIFAFTLIWSTSVKAKIFTEDYLSSVFSNNENYADIVELNNLLSSKNILVCEDDSTDIQCLDKASGQRYVVVSGLFQFRKINYQYDEVLERYIATNFEELSKTESDFFDHVQAKWLAAVSKLHNLEALKTKSDFTNMNTSKTPNSSVTQNSSTLGISFVNWLVTNNSSCGSGWNAPLVPDFPFADACTGHDICYSTYTSKKTCDKRFKEHMDIIASNAKGSDDTHIPWDFDLEFETFLILSQGAKLYESVVEDFGLEAYCANKPDEEYCLQIEGDYPAPGTGSEGSYGGVFFDGPGPGSGPGPYRPRDSSAGNRFITCNVTIQGRVCTGGGCTYWTEVVQC